MILGGAALVCLYYGVRAAALPRQDVNSLARQSRFARSGFIQ